MKKVRILAPCQVNREVVSPGDVVTVTPALARMLVNAKKGTYDLGEPAPEVPEAAMVETPEVAVVKPAKARKGD